MFWGTRGNLRQIADLALVAQGKHPHFVPLHDESIERDVSRCAERDANSRKSPSMRRPPADARKRFSTAD
jgi:hypothetical protein